MLKLKDKKRSKSNNRTKHNTVCTRFGQYRYRHHVRATFQTVLFVVLVGGFCVYNLIKYDQITGITPEFKQFHLEQQMNANEGTGGRRLSSITSDSSSAKTNGKPVTNKNENTNKMRNINKIMPPFQFEDDEQTNRFLQENTTADATTTATTTAPTAAKNTTATATEETNEADDTETCVTPDGPAWLSIFELMAVLYMFLALAIVCDEFFVPALEEMSSERHLDLSMDVAGATLMAAGGSAPELFTNLMGTFAETEIGIGTIVGSAVFNVLFVIALCALLSKETLQLTWWPLFRDSFCYSIGLIVLTVFLGFSSKGVIELHETIILFSMYIVYVFVMWKNADIYRFLTGKDLEDDVEEEVEEDQGPRANMKNSSDSFRKKNEYFRWQGTFRAGILKLLRNPESWVETVGNGLVARIYGDCELVFKQIDENKDGCIDKNELKRLFELLECEVTQAELDDVFDSLDTDRSGSIDEKEFQMWYVQSEERIRSQVKVVFDEIDINHSNTIDRTELALLLERLDSMVTDKDIENAVEQMYKVGSRDEISYEEFSDWYRKSILFERQKKQVDEEVAGVWEMVTPPWGEGIVPWFYYILVIPLVLAMALTIPDVRRPGMGKWCYAAFTLSILWIALTSFVMVFYTTIVGNRLGIPSVIMGLTLVSAGTSVPDMLSSVIVARRGNGDMAVSSSIGSNIFDILFGMPVPWFLYIVWPTTTNNTFKIDSDGIFVLILILLSMVVFVIVAIHCQGWKLTKSLAGMMLAFYVGFLVYSIYSQLPLLSCS